MARKGLMTTQKAKYKNLEQSDRVARDLRADVEDELGKLAGITVEEYTAPVAAVANAILLAKATTVAPASYSGAGLDGAVGGAVMAYGRNITVTTAGATPADAPATVLVTGLRRGVVQTETITVAQTATIATGVKAFDTVTSLAFAAADGTAATVAVGFGAALGTVATPKSRKGLCNIIAETANSAKVTNGVLTADLYTPNSVPNATLNYVIYFEFDATVRFTP